jgi:hypothetical protein
MSTKRISILIDFKGRMYHISASRDLEELIRAQKTMTVKATYCYQWLMLSSA